MGFRRPTANTPLDSKREDPLERAKRLARRITPEEQIERGLGVLEDAGFDSDQIDYMAGLVGCKAEDLAISISTASPHIGASRRPGTSSSRPRGAPEPTNTASKPSSSSPFRLSTQVDSEFRRRGARCSRPPHRSLPRAGEISGFGCG